jgi:hypothetical protein
VRPHHPPHLLATAVLVVISGAVIGLAAAGNIGPFASLGATAQRTVSAQPPRTPLRADSLFPLPTPPPPSHEVIVVRDPAPPYVATRTPISRLESPDPAAAPTSAPSPSPSACDDGCGGGGDG